MSDEQQAYYELSAYTLTHGGPEFLHQYVVDAYAVQNANDDSKQIGVTFALVGLYLHAERGFTGREVQLAHMKLARNRRSWPTFRLPEKRGDITAIDVMSRPEGQARDEAIRAWARVVWSACEETRDDVTGILQQYDII